MAKFTACRSDIPALFQKFSGAGLWLLLPLCHLYGAFYSISLYFFLYHLLDFIPLDLENSPQNEGSFDIFICEKRAILNRSPNCLPQSVIKRSGTPGHRVCHSSYLPGPSGPARRIYSSGQPSRPISLTRALSTAPSLGATSWMTWKSSALSFFSRPWG